MEEKIKLSLLEKARQHVELIREKISSVLPLKEEQLKKMGQEVLRMSAGDAMTQREIMRDLATQATNLKKLYPSPYFSKCEFEEKSRANIMYFGKFSFLDEKIYSWVTPAARLRFENPGKVSYSRRDGTERSGILREKDQYMISNGKILFYATESINEPRQLIYQENFTDHKQGFILPEVVEQMEKAQDQIIRAHYRGPLVISGPAGSGKTTLALHRLAYLAQSPESAEYFTPESVKVLVQDEGTRGYFSQLLPDLGITGVEIQTFAGWAIELLEIDGYQYLPTFGDSYLDKLKYEYVKLMALKNVASEKISKNPYLILDNIYEKYFDEKLREKWNGQQKEKILDRVDLTILLLAKRQNDGEFFTEKEYYQKLKNGEYKKKHGKFPVNYNLMIVDEFENYLPQQLEIISSVLNPRFNAVVYVGDLAQQTQLGTVKNLSQLNLDLKNYYFTKNIS